MLGVVIWCDEASKKAVIWCEDHGDLAFYKEQDAKEAIMLGAGDLVEFDVLMEREFRYARNPQLVSESYSSGLADAIHVTATQTSQKPSKHGSADVIPFETARAERVKPGQVQSGR